MEDNLHNISSGHQRDGAAPDQEISPTTERLAVYPLLYLIDQRLPAYISRVNAYDLQSKSLKDMQPQIAEQEMKA